METEIKNALISNVTLTRGDHGVLSAWLNLDYGGTVQGFGGHSLYLPKGFAHAGQSDNFAGHFIYRCLQIGDVDKWEDLKGKTIRVKANHGGVESIGHILKDDWFNPSEDFKKMKE